MVPGLAVNTYLPGLPSLARDFQVGASTAQVTMTTYFVGLAVGQLAGGSLSDAYGRRRPVIAAMAVFSIASVACALAPSLYTLAALRFVQGSAAAAGIAIARAVVRDLYAGAAAARFLSRLLLVVGLSPILAPLIGSLVLRFASWRAVFVVLAAVGLTLVVATALLLPETHSSDHRRASGLDATVGAFGALLRQRAFVGFLLVSGFGSATIWSFIVGSAFVIEDVYHTSAQAYGILYGISGVVLVIGAQINAHLLARHSPRRMLGVGVTMLAVAAGALLVVVLLPGGSFVRVIPCFLLVFFSWTFVQANSNALALTDHPGAAGAASALLGICQYASGAIVAPLVGLGADGTALPTAIVVASSALLAVLSLRRVPSVREMEFRAVPAEA
jgi:DHA1 family bicyclomycin/chloramphenicol resistance-like MFS transporter